ncbi:MAG: hypothetical protein II182_09060, partial [Lachnospiraceae bacterium]|nr:hypothetical protein [Lachnospiraceae bacterium]
MSSEVGKLFEQFLVTGKHIQQLPVIVQLVERCAVLIAIVEGKSLQQVSVGHVDIIAGDAGSVACDKDVRHDAATAIDRAAIKRGEHLALVHL